MGTDLKTIAFFNNKGGVGNTSLVYHLAWMFADLGIPILAVDLDPQADLTALFLDKGRLESLWPGEDEHPATVYGAIHPILSGLGDIGVPPVEWIGNNLGLLPGDLGLSLVEAKLSNWPTGESSLSITAAFSRVLEEMAKGWAKLALIDCGPNLGAINRAALMASDHVCLPLVPGLYSVQALKNAGAAFTQWRADWSAPGGQGLAPRRMEPCGYVVMGNFRQNPIRPNYPLLNQIPSAYRTHVLNQPLPESMPLIADDPNCLAQLKQSRSLMPLALEAHKPVFDLRPADGAIGAHAEAVRQSKVEFVRLANTIAAAVGLPMPSTAI